MTTGTDNAARPANGSGRDRVAACLARYSTKFVSQRRNLDLFVRK